MRTARLYAVRAHACCGELSEGHEDSPRGASALLSRATDTIHGQAQAVHVNGGLLLLATSPPILLALPARISLRVSSAQSAFL